MPYGSRLETTADYREMVDEFDPPRFFFEIHDMEDGEFFDEFN